MNHLTMREFGRWGRFGNQIFQYGFLKLYARQFGCELQLPPWVGNVLFGANDPPVTVTLPQTRESTNHLEQAEPPQGDEYVGRDFQGYAQYHTAYYRPHRKFLRDLFRPTTEMLARMAPARDRIRDLGHTVVGLHLRRGDFGRLCFYVTPVRWYLDWLQANWDRLYDPVLVIATETPALVEEFAAYKPLTAETLGVKLGREPMGNYNYLAADLRRREPWQLDFFPDWYLLRFADVVLAGNSTFSFTAAMLGSCGEFWRSSLPEAGFVREDPWNAYPFQHDRAEDYRHLDGVCLDETPYWVRLPDGKFKER